MLTLKNQYKKFSSRNTNFKTFSKYVTVIVKILKLKMHTKKQNRQKSDKKV